MFVIISKCMKDNIFGGRVKSDLFHVCGAEQNIYNMLNAPPMVHENANFHQICSREHSYSSEPAKSMVEIS
ncbi:hypothetical protein XELAEV_18014657mg [Xenopus laevis]|uniref:Uncharacterized protein n=1 Tax=Xenopus laevis TaxID=8355 RepID=A0A974DGK2_XENLA|nr:hypothetical protein XELAEV_18014657mg [Xenopus laevis]